MQRLAWILNLALVVPAGCGSDTEAAETRQEIDEAVDAVQGYAAEQLGELKASVRAGWADLEVELARLKAEAEGKSEAVQQEAQAAIDEIEAKIQAASEELESALDAAEPQARSSLEALKESLQSAKAALEQAWEQVRGG